MRRSLFPVEYEEQHDRGFTLLEVLVALSILGIAVTLVFQLFSANLRTINLSEDYVSATVRAEARMREVLDDDNLSERTWGEATGDGYRLHISVSEALRQRTETLPIRLLEIVLTIYWKKDAKEKSMTFHTMKMVLKKV